jgi:hypothetical protein
MQSLFHILSDAAEQECGGLATQSAMLPHPQQGAVEQDRRGVWVWGHAGWYADPPISGNPGSASRARGGRENYRWDKALSISMPNESK